MAIDKAVDSTQLDTDLTSVANAIRAKSGGSSQLAFPAGFVSEIGNIPSGWTVDGFLTRTEPTGEVTLNSTAFSITLAQFNLVTRVNIVNATTVPSNFLNKMTGLVTIFAPKVVYTSNSYLCENANNLLTVVIKRPGGNYSLAHCSKLAVVDISAGPIGGRNVFEKDYALKTIILRSSNVIALTSLDSLDNNTPFKSGGTGGTIYIPESLYNHLGDGTADDYKAASNWSTLDGYGTITWAKIEGSAYDGYYADGTPIPAE